MKITRPILAVSVILLYTGCEIVPRQVYDVVALPDYQALVGKRYRLKVDCYVTEWENRHAHFLVPDTAKWFGFPLPVSSNHLGTVQNRERLVGIIPKETEIEIIDIRHVRSLNYDILDYVISVIGDENIPWKFICARRITDQYASPPEIKPEFASELPSRQGQGALE